MRRRRDGLVVGKFYPPHAGHVALLSASLESCPRVIVLCLGSRADSLPPADRVSALMRDASAAGVDTRRLIPLSGYDEAPFDLEDPAMWASHVDVIAAHLRPFPFIRLLLACERYARELGERLGLEWVEMERVAGHSSTKLRRDLIAYWDELGPGTRGLLSLRVVLLGAESTGTSTIAALLTEALRSRGGTWATVQLVGEVGRTVTEAKQAAVSGSEGKRPLSVAWEHRDFAKIARLQQAAEDAAASRGGPVTVCDTDAFVTPVWERRYLGTPRLDPSTLGRGHLYLLTHHDGVPFVQDGTRDGQALRGEMTRWFEEALVRHGRPWATLRGTVDERLAAATRIVDASVRRRFEFRMPL